MKIEVTLTTFEVQYAISLYLQEKFKQLATRGEYIAVVRVGEPHDEVTYSIEIRREPADD